MLRRLDAGRSLRLLELALVVGAALFALGFHLTLPSRLAGRDDWRALAAHVEAHAAPGDAVVLHPWWTDEARLYLPERVPLHGDPHAAARDHVEAPRLWVVSQPSLPRADLRAFEAAFLPGREPLGDAVTFGTLRLRPYRNLRHRPVIFDATGAFSRAQAWIESPGAPDQRCRRTGAGLGCPGVGRLRAGPHEVDFAPLSCIPLPPPGGDARLVIDLPGIPVGGDVLIEGGIVGEQAWKTGGDLSALSYGVDAGTATLHEAVLPPRTEGLQSVTLPLPAGTTTLRLWSKAARPGPRVPCVSLRVLGRAGQEAGAP